ncbi:MAG: CHASE3 domain-containing protein [Pirellulales bacterium]
MRLRTHFAFKPFLKSVCTTTIAHSLWLAMGLLIAVGIFSFWNTSALIQTNSSRQPLRMLLYELQGTLSLVADAETGSRGYVLIGEEAYLEPYQAAVKAADQQIDRLEKQMNALPGQRSNFDALQRLVAMKFAVMKNTVQLRQSEGIEAATQAVRTGRDKAMMDEIRVLVDQIKQEVEKVMAKYDSRTAAIARRATVWGILGNVLAAVLFVSVLRREFRERKRAETRAGELAERTAQVEAANKELDSFSYSISHDLRAPLRAIDGFSRIVLEDYSGGLASEGKAYLQKVRDNTRQMGQLVDDLLAFARLGRQPLARHPVEPDKIVRRCLEEMTKEQQGRQVKIVIGDLCSCDADPALLKQIWTNLLSNALKYTRKRETARIEIGCRTEPRLVMNGQPTSPASAGPDVVYFVKDNGTGFDMKYAGKLFGVFQRLHSAADYEGTGVGLAIVQRIIQRHGGRIWGEATPNEGATFSFTLE